MTGTRMQAFLHIHPDDNVLVALKDLPSGTPIDFKSEGAVQLGQDDFIPWKRGVSL